MNNSARHNPALAAYINGWQRFIANIPDPTRNHAILKLAHDDLQNALSNYRKWSVREAPAPRDYPTLWQSPVASLHDCGGYGPVVFAIPSLINSYHILDLHPNASLIEYLKSQGFRVALLKWAEVKPECPHTSKDYVAAICEAGRAIGEEYSAIGYCVGGTLLNMAAQNMPSLKRQILLGAPWNFHHDQGQIGAWAQSLSTHTHLEAFFDQTNTLYGLVPSTMVDYFFAGLNPLQFVQKFRDANHADPIFDALESWLTSGLDMSHAFSRELVLEWMRDNMLMKAGVSHNTPSLIIHGKRDHIAPPASCLDIAMTTTQHTIHGHPSGHVGLMIGRSARTELWPSIVNYLQNDTTQ